jgi:hypothetical protein
LISIGTVDSGLLNVKAATILVDTGIPDICPWLQLIHRLIEGATIVCMRALALHVISCFE